MLETTFFLKSQAFGLGVAGKSALESMSLKMRWFECSYEFQSNKCYDELVFNRDKWCNDKEGGASWLGYMEGEGMVETFETGDEKRVVGEEEGNKWQSILRNGA